MTWMIMQNSTPNFQVAPQFDKMMWPFVKCKPARGNEWYRISAEVTSSSESKTPSSRQIVHGTDFSLERTSRMRMSLCPAVTGRHFGWIFNQWWHNQPGLLWGWDETLPVPQSHEKTFQDGVSLLQAPSSWTCGGPTCLLTTRVGSRLLDGVSGACPHWKEWDFIPAPSACSVTSVMSNSLRPYGL